MTKITTFTRLATLVRQSKLIDSVRKLRLSSTFLSKTSSKQNKLPNNKSMSYNKWDKWTERRTFVNRNQCIL